jgi:hypothetical protein
MRVRALSASVVWSLWFVGVASGVGAPVVVADLFERCLVEAVGCALAGLVCGTVGVEQCGGHRGGPQLAVGVGVGD